MKQVKAHLNVGKYRLDVALDLIEAGKHKIALRNIDFAIGSLEKAKKRLRLHF